MTTYSAITTGQTDAESPFDTTLADQYRDNVLAIQEGDPTAPNMGEGAFSASINQTGLKATSGTQSTTNTSATIVTLPGGAYGFFERHKIANALATGYKTISNCGTTSTSYVTLLQIHTSDGTYAVTAEQTYVQASPPYNMGDGDIPLFIFLSFKGRKISSIYVAPEAPWHYNGPTDIKATRKDRVTGKSYKKMTALKACCLEENITAKDIMARSMREFNELLELPKTTIELTQDMKNRDMNIIPSPFFEKGAKTVLLDPVSEIAEKLLILHDDGESIADVIYDGYFKINNSDLDRCCPKGVQVVGYRWKS